MKKITDDDFEKIETGDFKYRVQTGKRTEDTINQYLQALKKFDDYLVENGEELTLQAFDDFMTWLRKNEVPAKSQAKYYWSIELFLTTMMVWINSPGIGCAY